MAQYMSGEPDAHDGFVRLDDSDIHVVQDGTPGAPGVLLIHGTGASTAWWDPVVPRLAGACWVMRVDLAGHERSSSPAGGYDIPARPAVLVRAVRQCGQVPGPLVTVKHPGQRSVRRCPFRDIGASQHRRPGQRVGETDPARAEHRIGVVC